MRGWSVAWLLSLVALFSAFEAFAPQQRVSAAVTAVASERERAPGSGSGSLSPGPAFALAVLPPAPDLTPALVTSGSLDSRFVPFDSYKPASTSETFWVRLQASAPFHPTGEVPVFIARGGWYERTQAFLAGPAPEGGEPLPRVNDVPEFGGAHQTLFILPQGLAPGQTLYARVHIREEGKRSLRFSTGTLDRALARAAIHSRMIALAVGALTSIAVGSLLIWFILKDRLFLLYPGIFLLQALYLAYFSGEGFEWPLLALARPIAGYTWNVSVALGGAVASLFVREIADLRHSSPRVYKIFGVLAWAFVALAISNIADLVGWGDLVAAAGNLLFLGSAVFTLVVAFLAWRNGNRAAGWFLIAWMMLESFTITTAIRLLTSGVEQAEGLLYYGLPFSMVAAAILVALGVADRLREQRRALSEAERRAQTDPLTGVLNRRSLLERLEAACLRARARGLPIALLFIDLDHFKQINDSYGHAAGDACLRAIIGPIQTELRHSDVIGRYGGEEFVVILSSADMAAAHPIAERIRKRVADTQVEGFGPSIKLTCSIGVATSDTLGVWGEHLIAQADVAVYDAKRSGRNRVQVATSKAAA